MMESKKFRIALENYFKKYRSHPQYTFWINDHLLKVGVPNSRLLDYIHLVVGYIHKTYMPNIKKEDIRILDLGCGMGELTTYLALLGYNVVGVDMDKEQLELATILKEDNKAKVEFINADATKLPFKNNVFNIIICFDVFEHVKDLQPLCIEMKRVLKNDGIIFLRFPNKLKNYEDHVGLPLLPLLPERIFQFVFQKITKSRKYYQEGLQVYYRRFSEVYKVLRGCGFYISQLPENLMFPKLPVLYEQFIVKNNNIKYLPIVSPYFHLLLTKYPTRYSIQSFSINMEILELLWWILILIISIGFIFKNILSRKISKIVGGLQKCR